MTTALEKVAAGKVVQFSYYITDRHEDVVERVDLPLNMVFMRHNRLYDSVEQALLGCRAGDEISVAISPNEGAWGAANPDLILVEALANVPPSYRQVGQEAQFQNEQGDVKTFRITQVTDETVTLDGNHPFAGQTMNFHVKVLAVREATADELLNGIESGAPGSMPESTVH